MGDMREQTSENSECSENLFNQITLAFVEAANQTKQGKRYLKLWGRNSVNRDRISGLMWCAKCHASSNYAISASYFDVRKNSEGDIQIEVLVSRKPKKVHKTFTVQLRPQDLRLNYSIRKSLR